MNLFVLMVFGVMLAALVGGTGASTPKGQDPLAGVKALYNGIVGIWATIVNALLGKPAPAWVGQDVAPPGTGGINCTKQHGVVTCKKG